MCVSPRWVLFTCLLVLNVLDVYLTMRGIELGVMRETNPIMRRVIGDFWLATAVKVGSMGAIAIGLRSLRPLWTFMECVLAVAIGWFLAVVLWNLSIIWPHVAVG